ncbi:transposase [Corallococcus sp. NCSPR001]|nr:transposase [Corallococcus sp. NCRR]MBN9686131.1 transposase [Corallococcus sp. NCSPR001]WAS82434.1 transposase [Corallococcus sp. NCRR]
MLALVSSHRESEESWAEARRDLKKQGLEEPRLVVADGHLGIRGAAAQVWPQAEHQHCFNHKLPNVLDKLPKKELAAARVLLKPIPHAVTRAEAEAQCDTFVAENQQKEPKATACLLHDWERLVTYYRFPKQHWKHLRTANSIASPFASLRLRTYAAKHSHKVENATVLLWKPLFVAQKSFRKLDAAEHLRDVLAGRTYEGGNLVMLPPGTRRAAKHVSTPIDTTSQAVRSSTTNLRLPTTGWLKFSASISHRTS